MDDLISHSISNSIPKDDNIGRILSLVILSEILQSSLKSRTQFLSNNFLSLLLNDMFGEVLTHCCVCRGSKADHRPWTPRMTNINANQHGPELVDRVWEFEMENISANFAVDLLKHITRNRHVEFIGNSSCNHLRTDLKLVKNLFSARITLFLSQN